MPTHPDTAILQERGIGEDLVRASLPIGVALVVPIDNHLGFEIQATEPIVEVLRVLHVAESREIAGVHKDVTFGKLEMAVHAVSVANADDPSTLTRCCWRS